MFTPHRNTLALAARRAVMAPSLLNTQPWHWRTEANTLELHADRTRQLAVADPEGRMLLLSCGAALHHARVAVEAAGWLPDVNRVVAGFDDGLLARVRLEHRWAASTMALALDRAIPLRHTDRRPFTDEPLPDESMVEMRRAVEAEGLRLHRVRPEQMGVLAAAAAAAGATELAGADYRRELAEWTSRPPESSDGVPAETTVRPTPRRVPVRQLTVAADEGVDAGAGGDRGASYLIVFGHGDEAADWLRAGEAASAALLTATALGLATAPISDVIEVEDSRRQVRALLAGMGQPYLVLRCGFGDDSAGTPRAPRRRPEDVIEGLG